MSEFDREEENQESFEDQEKGATSESVDDLGIPQESGEILTEEYPGSAAAGRWTRLVCCPLLFWIRE
jgi:hypothetical protein